MVEKFPANAIQDPTAFMSSETMDIYNNILVFIIADQTSHPPEMQMHIFQVMDLLYIINFNILLNIRGHPDEMDIS